MTLIGVLVQGNQAGAGTPGHNGMGTTGSSGSNGNPGGSGGNGGDGGGLYNAGPLTLIDDTILGNSAGAGGDGGAGAPGGPGSYFFPSGAGGQGGNAGDGGFGGGIYNAGGLIAVNVTLAGNMGGLAGRPGVGGGGGYAYSGPPGPAGSPGQVGTSGSGGALYNTSGTIALRNATIVGNQVGSNAAGAGIASTSTVAAAVTIGNTIVALNTGTSTSPDVASASLKSLGHNFIGIADGSAGWSGTDLIGTTASPLDPRLQPVADNGGPTPTMLPAWESPVVDAGDNALVTNPPFPGPPFTDQRGLPRIADGTGTGMPRVDIGAVEVQPFAVPPPVVTTTADSGTLPGPVTLRLAMELSRRESGHPAVTFDIPTTDRGYNASTNSFTITLDPKQGPLELSTDLQISGPGSSAIIISGGKSTRVFQVDAGATVGISGVTITNGSTESGGGILNNGTLTLTNSVVSENSAGTTGGGIFNDGTLNLSDSTIASNTSGGNGGGIENTATGQLTISASTISGNTSQGSGGGLYSSGVLTLVNDTLARNTAGASGGGVYADGTATLTNDTVASNTAPTGGGIYVVANPFAGNVTLYNTIVANNTTGDISGSLDSHLASGQSPSSHNLIGNDSKLGPLADNGGPTQTMALLPGSPAIDAGNNALAFGPDGKPLLTDQRGYARIVNGTIDIGAYESGSSIPGDANGDGIVGFKDLVILASHYGQQSGATFAQGDFNGDGKVDFADLVILAQNYGRNLASAVAPADAGASNPAIDLLRPPIRRRGRR